MAVLTLSAEIKTPSRNPPAAPVAGSLHTNFTAPTTAADGVDFIAQGNEIITVLNSGASAYTFSITSEPDALGRTAHMTNYSLAAGEAAQFQLPKSGWANASSGKILITMSNAAVKVLVTRPAGLVNS